MRENRTDYEYGKRIAEELDKELESEGISVDEELIGRVLEKAAAQDEKKKRRQKNFNIFYKRALGAVAGLLLAVAGLSLVTGLSKKNMSNQENYTDSVTLPQHGSSSNNNSEASDKNISMDSFCSEGTKTESAVNGGMAEDMIAEESTSSDMFNSEEKKETEEFKDILYAAEKRSISADEKLAEYILNTVMAAEQTKIASDDAFGYFEELAEYIIYIEQTDEYAAVCSDGILVMLGKDRTINSFYSEEIQDLLEFISKNTK